MKNDPVDPCDICGDGGFPENIATCANCKIALEHSYCMKILPLDFPEYWICEECQSTRDGRFPRSGKKDRLLVHSMPAFTNMQNGSTHRMGASRFCGDSEKSMHFKRKIAVKTSKVKFITNEEAIKLSAESQKLQNFPPRKCQLSFGKSNTVSKSSITPAELKSSISECSRPKEKMKPDFRPSMHSQTPEYLKAKHNSIARQQVCQLKDKISLANQDEQVFRKEPAGYQMPSERLKASKLAATKSINQKPADTTFSAERVETSNSSAEKVIKHSDGKEPTESPFFVKRVKNSKSGQVKATTVFTPSPSRDTPPIISLGGSLDDDDVHSKILTGQGSNPPISLCKLENCFPNYHVSEATWCGRLEIVCSASQSMIYDGLQAYLANIVQRKAFEISNKLPGMLECTMVPSTNMKVQMFGNEHPDKNDVAFYLLPENSERSQQYRKLLVILEKKDSILRCLVTNVELFLLPSQWLHGDFKGELYKKLDKMQCKCLKLKAGLHFNFTVFPDAGMGLFLWGVYRPVKSNPTVSSLRSRNAASKAPGFDSRLHIKQHSFKAKAETTANFSDVPPGFPN